MREIYKGVFVSKEFIEAFEEAERKKKEKAKKAKAEAKAKLKEAYKNGEIKRKRFWFF